MKDNGGLLEEVIFAVNTNNEEDLAYLEKLLPTHPRYKKHEQSDKSQGPWDGLWEAITEPDTVYVKVDDDVVSGYPHAGSSPLLLYLSPIPGTAY